MTAPLTRKEVAAQLRQLADQLDPPAPPTPGNEACASIPEARRAGVDLAHEILRAAGVREPHLTRLASSKHPDTIIAWLGYLIETNYPAEHRIGYMIKRLDAGNMPPAGPHGYTVEDILPRLPRQLRR
jgi:hypothetical protein